MSIKDWLHTIILLAILIVIIKILQQTKPAQPKEVAEKAITQSNYNYKRVSDIEKSENDEAPAKKNRKIRLKTTYNRVLRILHGEQAPMTNKALVILYNAKHKEIGLTTLSAWLNWLKKYDMANYEEMDGGQKVWGLSEWFEDNELSEEFFAKIKL